MKKLILGITWQVLGFHGALVIVCTAAPHRWNYNGIEGLFGSLLGLDLLLPLIICIGLFAVGAIITLIDFKRKQ